MGISIAKATPTQPSLDAPHPKLYWTADRSALVEEGDVRAAFLAYASFDPIDPAHLALLISTEPEAETEAEVAPKPRTRRKGA